MVGRRRGNLVVPQPRRRRVARIQRVRGWCIGKNGNLSIPLCCFAVPCASSPQQPSQNEPGIFHSGTADRVVFDTPPSTMSADEVVMFEALIYDAVNNPVSGEIAWSASNGTITDDGLFYPWSSGLIEIIAEHNGLRDSHNITVVPGVPTSIEITSLNFGVLEAQTSPRCLDSRGNPAIGGAGMVWDVDGAYLGHGTPSLGPGRDWTKSRSVSDTTNCRTKQRWTFKQGNHMPLFSKKICKSVRGF